MFKNMHIVALAMLLLLVCSSAHAAPVTAKLDRNNVVVGESVTLVLQTNDTDQSLDADLSILQADFDVLDRRSETQMSFVNGRKTAYVRLVVTLEPKHAGNLTIRTKKRSKGWRQLWREVLLPCCRKWIVLMAI